ncbi:MAG: hypothetical protein H2174_05575 [Vampirovibrio sp.]|nr:hypothetical protein [Vampirovibrio sp.]
MLFLPLRWTERIDDCRANAMVVPTGGHVIEFLIVTTNPSICKESIDPIHF